MAILWEITVKFNKIDSEQNYFSFISHSILIYAFKDNKKKIKYSLEYVVSKAFPIDQQYILVEHQKLQVF